MLTTRVQRPRGRHGSSRVAGVCPAGSAGCRGSVPGRRAGDGSSGLRSGLAAMMLLFYSIGAACCSPNASTIALNASLAFSICLSV